jgi:hypothetical protein
MPLGVGFPQTAPGVGGQVSSQDPLGTRDSPAYYADNTAMMIGNSGTVAANNNVGNITLGTALDAVYGPSNNGCPGIWLYLPSTALASPNNVAGWYWAVMTSTTVGTVYGIGFTPGVAVYQGTAAMVGAGALVNNYPPGITLNQVAGSQSFESSPTGGSFPGTLAMGGVPQGFLVPSFPDAPPPSMVVAANIATGTGSGYTGVTTEQAAASYQLQGGAVGPAGSMCFEGVVSATNSAGAKNARGKVGSAANLTSSSPATVVNQSLTTGVSAIIAKTFVMWDGHPANTPSGTTNSGKFVTAGSTPTFFTLDESGGASGTTPMYVGVTLQVAVATDWAILQGHYITVNPV